MMTEAPYGNRLTPETLARKAIVYLRQSSEKQVQRNLQSQRLQYALADRARQLGWQDVEIIDTDLGASASMGAAPRKGFEQVVSSVALGEVGIVLSREVSRLSRTDKDWCHLLEVCQLFRTLIGDAEHIYDLSSLDDRLVLGIKATMSSAELAVLKMRMQQGQEEKARRGELVRLLPPGYIRDATNQVVKDPDQRVQQAIGLVFKKFRETWSARQTFLWFHHEGVELPVNKSVSGRMTLLWQLPTHSFVRGVLKNPFFAGAYVYGQRPRETVLIDGRLVRRTGRTLEPEECKVFIPEHHEGYIDWPTYQEHRRMMARNAQRVTQDETVAAVRAGNGLLSGLLRCGRCGHRLRVRYWGKHGTAARYLCIGDYDAGGSYCLSFGGSTVDRRFGQELLTVLSPLGVEASLEALDRMQSGEDERRHALALQLEQTEYETRRAFEQYDEVDPRNRLVARELERRWNTKLEEADELTSSLSALDRKTRSFDEEARATVRALGECFAEVWWSERCPIELKKKIVRTVIEEIIVDLDEATDTLSFIIHWKGGSHTRFDMPKPRSGIGQRTKDEDLDIVRRMAVRYGDGTIACVLNRLGRRTGKGKRWNQHRVYTVRRNHSIPGQKGTLPDPEVLTLGQAALHVGVSRTTIKKLVSSGLLEKEQVVPWAPWEIQRSDLDSDPVRGIVERLRKTGKLVLEGDDSTNQQKLFQ
jgi:DNA invertase Pin-like site-specific DNA recombinase